MSKILKLAERFEQILKQAQMPMQDISIESPDALDTWLAKNFSISEKNKIANIINQMLADKGIDLKSLQTNVSIQNKKLIVTAIVNNNSNSEAATIISNAILAKKPNLDKFNKQSTPWIKYPK
jgi:hypothetical protein